MAEQTPQIPKTIIKLNLKHEETIGNVQSFVSCYLFILIFFIMLVTYGNIETAKYEASGLGFLKSGLLAKEMMIVTEEEKLRAETKQSYQEMIKKIVPNTNIKWLQEYEGEIIADVSKNHNLIQKIEFDFSEIFDERSRHPNAKMQKIIKHLVKIQKHFDNYHLSIHVSIFLKNMEDVSEQNFARASSLINEFLENKADKNLIIYNLENSPRDLVKIDISFHK